MTHYAQMDCKTDAGCKIQDNFSGRNMTNIKFKLMKGKTSDESTGTSNKTATTDNNKHRTTVLK